MVTGVFALVLLLAFPTPVLPTRIDPPCAPGSVGPNLTETSRGVLLSWLEPAGGAKPDSGTWALRYALFSGGRWSAPRTIATSERFFINWADFPSVVEARGGWLLAHWAEESGDDTYAYDVALARADGIEGPWRRIASPHDDKTETEHGFVSLVPEGNAVRAFWLDGREMKAGSHGGHGAGSMALRTALVSRDGTIGGGAILDTRTCECCNTAAAVTSEGPVIAFRDRSEKEVRDIAIVRKTASGWSSPSAVGVDGWEIAGCPVNGPAAAARDSNVAVAWFTAAGDRQAVRLAFSRDAGKSFGKPVAVDAAAPLGRVSLLLEPSGEAVIAWVGTSGGSPSVRLRRVPGAGAAGDAVSVAATTIDRSSGFPRIAPVPGGTLVAWVEAKTPAKIRAAVVDLPRR